VTAVLRRRQPCPFTIMYVWIVMPRSKKCSHCLSTTSKKSCARNVAASTLSKRQLLSSQWPLERASWRTRISIPEAEAFAGALSESPGFIWLREGRLRECRPLYLRVVMDLRRTDHDRRRGSFVSKAAWLRRILGRPSTSCFWPQLEVQHRNVQWSRGLWVPPAITDR